MKSVIAFLCSVVLSRAHAHLPIENIEALPTSRIHVDVLIYETDVVEKSAANSLKEQVSRLDGMTATIVGQGQKFEGFGSKFTAVLPSLQALERGRLVVLTDARDVLVNNPMNSSEFSRSAVLEFIEAFQALAKDSPGAIVISAEAQCCVSALTHFLPGDLFGVDGSRTKRACASGVTCQWDGDDKAKPWTDFMKSVAVEITGVEYDDVYLNAGLIVGYAGDLLAVIQEASISKEEDDQAVLTDFMYNNPDKIVLDYGQKLFGNNRWAALGVDEHACVFDVPEEASSNVTRLVHSKTLSTPLFLHSPGGFYECYDDLAKKLGLQYIFSQVRRRLDNYNYRQRDLVEKKKLLRKKDDMLFNKDMEGARSRLESFSSSAHIDDSTESHLSRVDREQGSLLQEGFPVRNSESKIQDIATTMKQDPIENDIEVTNFDNSRDPSNAQISTLDSEFTDDYPGINTHHESDDNTEEIREKDIQTEVNTVNEDVVPTSVNGKEYLARKFQLDSMQINTEVVNSDVGGDSINSQEGRLDSEYEGDDQGSDIMLKFDENTALEVDDLQGDDPDNGKLSESNDSAVAIGEEYDNNDQGINEFSDAMSQPNESSTEEEEDFQGGHQDIEALSESNDSVEAEEPEFDGDDQGADMFSKSNVNAFVGQEFDDVGQEFDGDDQGIDTLSESDDFDVAEVEARVD